MFGASVATLSKGYIWQPALIEDGEFCPKLGAPKSLSLLQRLLEVSLDPSPSWLGVKPSIWPSSPAAEAHSIAVYGPRRVEQIELRPFVVAE